jgi:hypothetical protein
MFIACARPRRAPARVGSEFPWDAIAKLLR